MLSFFLRMLFGGVLSKLVGGGRHISVRLGLLGHHLMGRRMRLLDPGLMSLRVRLLNPGLMGLRVRLLDSLMVGGRRMLGMGSSRVLGVGMRSLMGVHHGMLRLFLPKFSLKVLNFLLDILLLRFLFLMFLRMRHRVHLLDLPLSFFKVLFSFVLSLHLLSLLLQSLELSLLQADLLLLL